MGEQSRRSPRTASDILAAVETRSPGAVALAAVMPHAARIERPLLRAVRLHVLPHLRAADEAALWTSDLVEVRGIDGLTLRADILEILRDRARASLRAGDRAAAQIKRAHEFVRAHHASSPPLVQLEEEIGWFAMTADDPGAQIQAKLEVALAALVRDQRVGVARWAVRALPRLPRAGRATRAAWELSQATASHLPEGRRDLGVAPPPGTRVVDLATIAPHLRRTPLGIRRIGDRLELGAVGPGGAAILVPSTEPRFVEIRDPSRNDAVEVAVTAGGLKTIEVGWETLSLGSAAGDAWALPVLSEAETVWLRGVTAEMQGIADRRGDPEFHRRLGTLVKAGVILSALPRWDDRVYPRVQGRMFAGDRSSPWEWRHIIEDDVPDGLTLLRPNSTKISSAGAPLPLATAVTDGARVVSYGLDSDFHLVPMVGTWHDDPIEGSIVRARTRATAYGCHGAPIVVDGQLAGLVREARLISADGGTGEGQIQSEAAPQAEHALGAGGSGEMLLLVTSQGLDVDSKPAAETRAAVTVELLPAAYGEAVLVGWGPANERHHLLVDGGPRSTSKEITARVRQATGGKLDLVVVTHADADRVEGITELLKTDMAIDDVWFNGPSQLPSETGEKPPPPSVAVRRLLEAAASRSTRSDAPALNRAFDGGPVVVNSPSEFPRIELADGATITVLGPTGEKLARLAASWQRKANRGTSSGETDVTKGTDLDDTESEQENESQANRPAQTSAATQGPPFGSDGSTNNGSSIVLLFECQGRRVLLPGDAHAGPLLEGVRRLASQQKRSALFVDVFVLPHMGSAGNVTPDLFQAIEANTYAISTDGSRYGHPDAATIEAIAQTRPGTALAFNYRSQTTAPWADAAVVMKHNLQVSFPPEGGAGVVLTLRP